MIDTGIEKSTLDYLMQALASYKEIEKVLLFGSRAKGSSRPGSDIDLAIQGKNCTPELALDLKAFLNEKLPIPYFIDIVDFESIENAELKKHIERVGKVIYTSH